MGVTSSHHGGSEWVLHRQRLSRPVEEIIDLIRNDGFPRCRHQDGLATHSDAESYSVASRHDSRDLKTSRRPSADGQLAGEWRRDHTGCDDQGADSIPMSAVQFDSDAQGGAHERVGDLTHLAHAGHTAVQLSSHVNALFPAQHLTRIACVGRDRRPITLHLPEVISVAAANHH